MGYMPLVVASVLYTFNSKRWVLGSLFTSLSVALQLLANHYQISYYTAILLLIIGVVQLVKEIKLGTLPNFFKRSGALLVAALLALATNYTVFSTTLEYSKVSQRAPSELVTTDGQQKDDGMSFEYITEHSYGIDETLTFLIPNFKGGTIGPSVLEEEESATSFYLSSLSPNERNELHFNINDQRELQGATKKYWGDYNQRVKGPGSPTYVGAIIIFL